MKILFLTDGVHPFAVGGMQSHSRNLAIELAQLNCSIDLVHCGGAGYGVEKFRENFSDERITEHYIPFVDSGILPGHYVRANRKYSRNIRKKFESSLSQYDIIYCQGLTGMAFAGRMNRKAVKAPVLVNLHGFEMFQCQADLKSKLGARILRKPVRKLMRDADGVYSFGGKIDEILRSLGIPENKILPNSNAVSGDWIKDRVNEHTVRQFVFVGRYERRKGIEELMKSLQVLSGQHQQFGFHFVGGIPDSKKWEHPKMTYHGVVRDRNQMKAILDSCDCLVCPSYAEGMPTVILEAMARGLAVIATDVGAVSRLCNENGILLANSEPHVITRAMEKVLAMEHSGLHHWKLNSLSLVRSRFAWDIAAGEIYEGFERMSKG